MKYFLGKPKIRVRRVGGGALAWDGQRWWVVSILWDNERPDNPIPEDMLKH